MKPKKIILCATQRCGSTMICEDIRNTGILGTPEEYFIPWVKGKDANWRKALAGIEKKGQTENGVFSVKIMSNQIFHINACMGEFYNVENCKSDFLFHYYQDAHWVFIRRRNIIRQAISRHVSRCSGVNHLKSSQEGYMPGNVQVGEEVSFKRRVEFDADQIYTDLNDIAYENKIWEQKFKRHKITPTRLFYEEIVSSESTQYLQDIGNAIEIDGPVEDVYDKRTLRKMSNSINDYLFNKFVEL